MFGLCRQNNIAGLQKRMLHCIGDLIERLGHVMRIGNLIRLTMNQPGKGFPRPVIETVIGHRNAIVAPVHVARMLRIKVSDRINDRLRLQCCGRVIKIDQIRVVPEHRKIAADFVYIEHSSSSFLSISSLSICLRSASSIVSAIGRRYPCASRAVHVLWSRPRDSM